MIIDTFAVPRGTRCVLQCDVCQTIFERRASSMCLERTLHMCSAACRHKASRKGGVLDQARRQRCLETHGVEHPTQTQEVRDKMKATCRERHGVDNAFQSEEKKAKARATMQHRHGAEHPMHVAAVKARVRKTCQARYGVDAPAQSAVVQEKMKTTFQSTLGVDNPWKSERVRAKCAATCQARYGVDNPSKSSVFQERKRATCREHYGVDSPLQSPANKAKCDFVGNAAAAHETKKRNGTYTRSTAEDSFHAVMSELFGAHDVERAVKIDHGNGNWIVDFYVKSIDTYVQFDGVYWHGLDRPIETIRQHLYARDVLIEQAFDRDQRQDEWFKQRDLRLVRVTDAEFKRMPRECIMRLVDESSRAR